MTFYTLLLFVVCRSDDRVEQQKKNTLELKWWMIQSLFLSPFRLKRLTILFRFRSRGWDSRGGLITNSNQISMKGTKNKKRLKWRLKSNFVRFCAYFESIFEVNSEIKTEK